MKRLFPLALAAVLAALLLGGAAVATDGDVLTYVDPQVGGKSQVFRAVEAVRRVKVRVTFETPVTGVIGGSSAILGFYHLAPDEMFVSGQVVIVEAWDDSGLVPEETAPNVEDPLNSTVIVAPVPFATVAEPFPNGLAINALPFAEAVPVPTVIADPALGGDLLYNFNAQLIGDGTTGISDVNLIIAPSVPYVLAPGTPP